MIFTKNEHLTAAEVRKLPVGSVVELHGYDRFGVPTTLECTVVKSVKSRIMTYHDWMGNLYKKPIKDYPNKYYTLKKRGEG